MAELRQTCNMSEIGKKKFPKRMRRIAKHVAHVLGIGLMKWSNEFIDLVKGISLQLIFVKNDARIAAHLSTYLSTSHSKSC